MSTYTILRASKLFEWNKLNPNSNEAKKAAALKRQLNGEIKRRTKTTSARKLKSPENDEEGSEDPEEKPKPTDITRADCSDEKELDFDPNLNLLSEYEILNIKSASSSAMVFATKILYKIFQLNELLGHNISGKTFNKFIKNKKALDQKRVYYIKWLVDTYYESNSKAELWKSCRNAINKSIRNNEIKGGILNEVSFKENKEIFNVSVNGSSGKAY